MPILVQFEYLHVILEQIVHRELFLPIFLCNIFPFYNGLECFQNKFQPLHFHNHSMEPLLPCAFFPHHYFFNLDCGLNNFAPVLSPNLLWYHHISTTPYQIP
jgi:hypothetical protein